MAAPVRVVLVHGSQLSAAQWWRYAALLGPDVELAVPDLPAHGSRRDEPFTWERALEVVGEAVDGSPGVPVVLVGHSLGGYLAMAYAAANPQRLSGLALLGASAVPAGPGAALYRAIASVEQRLGVDRMSRALDRQFDAMLPDELAAVIKEAGYGFDG
ncbi:MAG TPA: alpha/beta fold hydrolase, partial [Actinotalea sp.]|nr:alpha/beta fold hydrolase [Actinotalea sp.]